MKKTPYINAFSLQMIDTSKEVTVKFTPCAAPAVEEVESFIGHPDTAAVLGVPFNRGNVKLAAGDTAIIAQVVGGRLPEGTTSLPEGFKIVHIRAEIIGA